MSTTTKVVDREYLKQQFKNYDDVLVKPRITDLDNRKVEKVTGYGLSKNDFTDALKEKLEGIGDTELEDVDIDFEHIDDIDIQYRKPNGDLGNPDLMTFDPSQGETIQFVANVEGVTWSISSVSTELIDAQPIPYDAVSITENGLLTFLSEPTWNNPGKGMHGFLVHASKEGYNECAVEIHC